MFSFNKCLNKKFCFHRKSSAGKVLAFSVLSATVAGLLGFLSHKDNRQQAVSKINEAGDRLKDFGQETVQSTEKVAKDVADKAKQVASDIASNFSKEESTKPKVVEVQTTVKEEQKPRS